MSNACPELMLSRFLDGLTFLLEIAEFFLGLLRIVVVMEMHTVSHTKLDGLHSL